MEEFEVQPNWWFKFDALLHESRVENATPRRGTVLRGTAFSSTVGAVPTP
jgi:hypothetical protein